MCDIRDPIVIDPPGFDPSKGWQECKEYVEKCAGLTHDDGEPNWNTAFGADPGICSCPNCHADYWSWGRVLECLDCHFRFDSDWWSMYSWGVQERRRRQMEPLPPAYLNPSIRSRLDATHRERMTKSLYYRYGFEHPVDDPWKEHEKIPWKQILEGGEYPEATC